MAGSLFRILTAISAVTLSACNQQASSPEPKFTDKQIQILREALPGITEDCVTKLRFGGFEEMASETDQCFKMMPQQRWGGLWRREFEGSRFCPAPAQRCSGDDSGDNIWLTSRQQLAPETHSTGKLYAIEFLGRRTLERGHHGHMGMSQHEIIVDKVISIAPIEERGR